MHPPTPGPFDAGRRRFLSLGTAKVVAAAIVVACAVNAAIAFASIGEDGGDVVIATQDHGQVAAAALALAATAEPEAEIDLNPFEGLDLRSTAPVADSAAPLPVPEHPPADPYAPTPEVRHGTLSIPAIGLEQPLFEGVTLTAINRGPSHWPGTAMPGELGNVVIAGHRTTYTRPFWDLQALQPGDELIFEMTDGTRHVYVNRDIEIVDATAIHIIDQTPEHTATLFACHPRGSARQRIVGHFVYDPDASTTPVSPI